MTNEYEVPARRASDGKAENADGREHLSRSIIGLASKGDLNVWKLPPCPDDTHHLGFPKFGPIGEKSQGPSPSGEIPGSSRLSPEAPSETTHRISIQSEHRSPPVREQQGTSREAPTYQPFHPVSENPNKPEVTKHPPMQPRSPWATQHPPLQPHSPEATKQIHDETNRSG
jgi:hypothetical protein